MKIQEMISTLEIEKCFDVFLELRPHLKDAKTFVNQVILQQQEGYGIAYVIEAGAIAGCVGYRQMITLAWGKILYIDDLIVREEYRSKKYGSGLLKICHYSYKKPYM